MICDTFAIRKHVFHPGGAVNSRNWPSFATLPIPPILSDHVWTTCPGGQPNNRPGRVTKRGKQFEHFVETFVKKPMGAAARRAAS